MKYRIGILLFIVVALCAVGLMADFHDAEAWQTKSPRPKYYIGLSGETKPTQLPTTTGSEFFEYDTGRTYVYMDSTEAWTIMLPVQTTASQTITTVGSTTAFPFKGYNQFTVELDLTNNGSNVIVYVEVRTEDIGWVNANSLGDSTHITTNGVFSWKWSGVADSVRTTVSAGSGDTAFTALWQWVLGGDV